MVHVQKKTQAVDVGGYPENQPRNCAFSVQVFLDRPKLGRYGNVHKMGLHRKNPWKLRRWEKLHLWHMDCFIGWHRATYKYGTELEQSVVRNP